jgi:hypothetical protein
LFEESRWKGIGTVPGELAALERLTRNLSGDDPIDDVLAFDQRLRTAR